MARPASGAVAAAAMEVAGTISAANTVAASRDTHNGKEERLGTRLRGLSGGRGWATAIVHAGTQSPCATCIGADSGPQDDAVGACAVP